MSRRRCLAVATAIAVLAALRVAAAQDTLDRLRAAGVSQVVAMVRPGNKRSIAVTRRLGMHLAETYTHPTLDEDAHCYRLDL